jgi:C4-dicarboxylate transporter DctM subunit
LIVLNILLLVAGNFMEPTSVVLILTPIVFPIAMELGIDPVHLGVIMVLNMQIGLVTPPVGLNLFVTAGVAKMSMEKVIQASAPWLAVLLAVLIAITYIPWVSLVVPRMLGLI